MIKAVTLFLIFVGVLAMFGRLGWLGRQIGIGRRENLRLGRNGRCQGCGRPLVGRSECDCGKGAKRKG
ncbi:MAG: hypothetical protein ACK4KW_01490 [Gemmobacter sp.]